MNGRHGSTNEVGATLSATAVGIAGLLAIVVWVWLLGSLFGVATSEPSTAAILVSTVAGGLGTGSVAAVYIVTNDLGFEYLDLSRPTARGIGYVIGGTMLLLATNVGVRWLLRRAGVGATTHSIVRQAQQNPEILLVMIPLSYLVTAPGEELLYRNVVQKSLYGAFSKRAAVVVASAIFALVHYTSYFQPNAPLATLGSLSIVLVLSVVLGGIYARTQNLVIPLLVHGSFDAVAFAVTYVQLT